MSIGIKAPGKYTQGAGELSKLGMNVKKMGNKFFILCSANTRKRIGTHKTSVFHVKAAHIVNGAVPA